MGRNNPAVGIVSLLVTLGATGFMGFRENFFGVAVCALASVVVAADLVRRNKQKASGSLG